MNPGKLIPEFLSCLKWPEFSSVIVTVAKRKSEPSLFDLPEADDNGGTATASAAARHHAAAPATARRTSRCMKPRRRAISITRSRSSPRARCPMCATA